MDEFTIRSGALTLTATRAVGGWISTIDGLGEKRVSTNRDERSAKNACLQVAIATLRFRGDSIPICLINAEWASRAY
jgi:hypothetical protein